MPAQATSRRSWVAGDNSVPLCKHFWCKPYGAGLAMQIMALLELLLCSVSLGKATSTSRLASMLLDVVFDIIQA